MQKRRALVRALFSPHPQLNDLCLRPPKRLFPLRAAGGLPRRRLPPSGGLRRPPLSVLPRLQQLQGQRILRPLPRLAAPPPLLLSLQSVPSNKGAGIVTAAPSLAARAPRPGRSLTWAAACSCWRLRSAALAATCACSTLACSALGM